MAVLGGFASAAPNVVIDPEAGFALAPGTWAVSKTMWDGLPLVAQQLLWDRSDVFIADNITEKIFPNDAEMAKTVKAAGGSVTEFDEDARAALQEANEGLLDNLRGTDAVSDGDALVDAMEAANEKWAAKVKELGYDEDVSYNDFDTWYDPSSIDLTEYTDHRDGRDLRAAPPVLIDGPGRGTDPRPGPARATLEHPWRIWSRTRAQEDVMTERSAPRRRGLELLIEVPAVIVTFVMMIHITANAVLRTWFDNPIDNTLEITEYWYLPLVAFLGFIAAQHRGQHIAADLVYEMLPSVTKRFVLALVYVLCSLTSAGFAKYGWDAAVHAKDIGQTAGVSDLTAWPTYFLAPLAFGSLTVQFLYAAVQAIRHPSSDHVIADTEDAVVLEELAKMEAEKR